MGAATLCSFTAHHGVTAAVILLLDSFAGRAVCVQCCGKCEECSVRSLLSPQTVTGFGEC